MTPDWGILLVMRRLRDHIVNIPQEQKTRLAV
jgi:hypothetical protein